MSTIATPEIPATFGALDSDVYADGGPVDALVLRTLATSANRLMCTGEPLINLVWDASSDLGGDEAPGSFIGFGWPFWFRLTPLASRPKTPGQTLGHAIVRVKLRNTETMQVQVETRRRPFDASGASNILSITGTGSDAYVTLDDIPIDPSDTERIAFWARGDVTATTGNTGTYGAPNTGTIDRLQGYDLEDDSATWTTTVGATWAEGGHGVTFKDGGGTQIAEPRLITAVHATRLSVYPAFSYEEIAILAGATYTIVELPRWRVTQLALYAQDRTG